MPWPIVVTVHQCTAQTYNDNNNNNHNAIKGRNTHINRNNASQFALKIVGKLNCQEEEIGHFSFENKNHIRRQKTEHPLWKLCNCTLSISFCQISTRCASDLPFSCRARLIWYHSPLERSAKWRERERHTHRHRQAVVSLTVCEGIDLNIVFNLAATGMCI